MKSEICLVSNIANQCEKGGAEVECKDEGVNIAKYARCEWKCIV